MKSKYLTATEARKNFFKMIEEIVKKQNRVTITIDGKPKVVVMSYEEFEGWQETVEILSDEEMVKGIKEGLDDIKHGRTISFEELKKQYNL